MKIKEKESEYFFSNKESIESFAHTGEYNVRISTCLLHCDSVTLRHPPIEHRFV